MHVSATLPLNICERKSREPLLKHLHMVQLALVVKIGTKLRIFSAVLDAAKILNAICEALKSM